MKDISEKPSHNESPGIKVALAGNPNVGKSTVFNALTGLHQHTGNWSGKTVAGAVGTYFFHEIENTLVDTPGTYSLFALSEEEKVTRDYLASGEADVVVVICDAGALERNMNLVLQILSVHEHVVVCINLIDEAKKNGITVDGEKLEKILGVPVAETNARSGEGLEELKAKIQYAALNNFRPYRPIIAAASDGCDGKCSCSALCGENCGKMTEIVFRAGERICSEVVHSSVSSQAVVQIKLDKVLTKSVTGIPIMLMLLGVVFYITIVGANLPTSILSGGFAAVGSKLSLALDYISCPPQLKSMLIDGVYRTVSWVVSFMLPPMAIFFPMFTLLEDFGYLPRVAFNLDNAFRRCGACGKQSLTMCMGFGCNAAGVTGCRIIESPRERLVAIITNNFVPCNGRFPTLIALITIFFAGSTTASPVSALILTFFILLSVLVTLLVSKILSKTLLRGFPSSTALEMPPFRRPQIGKVIIRSVLDRTLFVLGRAVISALPAGLIIWLMANIPFSGGTVLSTTTEFLDPFARIIGLDGVILTAFILALPANEIFLPCAIMAYTVTGAITEYESLRELFSILSANGWTALTALNVMLFSLMHWPCATTLLTIKKETGSLKWALVSFAVPTVCGISICFITALVYRLFSL